MKRWFVIILMIVVILLLLTLTASKLLNSCLPAEPDIDIKTRLRDASYHRTFAGHTELLVLDTDHGSIFIWKPSADVQKFIAGIKPGWPVWIVADEKIRQGMVYHKNIQIDVGQGSKSGFIKIDGKP